MLSRRIADLAGSPVRAMLETAQRPEVISFAGGLPAPDSFADLDLPAPPLAWKAATASRTWVRAAAGRLVPSPWK